MLQQLLNKFLKPGHQAIEDVLNDIGSIYHHIDEMGEVYDDWYFHHIYTENYWRYLNYYPWLDMEKQNKLIEGCLNIILFTSYYFLKGKGEFLERHYNDISKSINQFVPATENHRKLHVAVKDALQLCEKKMKKNQYNNKISSIHNSIVWTLKNTILITTPKQNKINQR